MGRRFKTLFKIGLTLFALWYVWHKIDQAALKRVMQSADGFYLAIALLFFNLSKIVSAERLRLLFSAIGLGLSRSYNLLLYYVGMFYNLFLPGGIGGDGYKIYLLNRRFHRGIKPLFGAILYDRLSGLAALTFLAALLIAASDYARSIPYGRQGALIVVLAVYPIAYLATRSFFVMFIPVFVKTLGYGFVVQIFQLFCAWAILASLGIDDHRLDYLALFLLSSLLAVLPLTIGGVGIREMTFLYGLPLVGEDPTSGVGMAFLFFIITALSSLTGLFLLRRLERETEVQE